MAEWGEGVCVLLDCKERKSVSLCQDSSENMGKDVAVSGKNVDTTPWLSKYFPLLKNIPGFPALF